MDICIGILKLSNIEFKLINRKKYKKFYPFDLNIKPFYVMTKKNTLIDIYAVVSIEKKVILKYFENIDFNTVLTYHWKSFKNIIIDIPYTIKKLPENNIVFSLDPDNCKIIDDALQIINYENYVILNLFITNVIKFINKDMHIELLNRVKSIKNNNLFPDIIINKCSLKENNNYDVFKISLIIKNNKIIKYDFSKDNIYINKNFSYNNIDNKLLDNLKNLYFSLNNKYTNSKNIIKFFMETINNYAAMELINKNINNGVYCYKNNNYNIYKYTYIKYNYTHFTSPLRRYIDNYIHCLIFNYENNFNLNLNYINNKIKFYKKISSISKILQNKNDIFYLNVKCIFFVNNTIILYVQKLHTYMYLDIIDEFKRGYSFKDTFKTSINENEFIIYLNDKKYKLIKNQKIKIKIIKLKKNINFFNISIVEPFILDFLSI